MQRVISSLALLGYLASQLAAVPHAHAGVDASNHPRLHLHLSESEYSHHHGHSHGAGHHHHHEATPKSSLTAVEAPLGQPGSHDDDAIYLGHAELGRVTTGDVTGVWLSLLASLDFPVPVICEPEMIGSALPVPGSLPGQERLFLELGALRI